MATSVHRRLASDDGSTATAQALERAVLPVLDAAQADALRSALRVALEHPELSPHSVDCMLGGDQHASGCAKVVLRSDAAPGADVLHERLASIVAATYGVPLYVFDAMTLAVADNGADWSDNDDDEGDEGDNSGGGGSGGGGRSRAVRRRLAAQVRKSTAAASDGDGADSDDDVVDDATVPSPVGQSAWPKRSARGGRHGKQPVAAESDDDSASDTEDHASRLTDDADGAGDADDAPKRASRVSVRGGAARRAGGRPSRALPGSDATGGSGADAAESGGAEDGKQASSQSSPQSKHRVLQQRSMRLFSSQAPPKADSGPSESESDDVAQDEGIDFLGVPLAGLLGGGDRDDRNEEFSSAVLRGLTELASAVNGTGPAVVLVRDASLLPVSAAELVGVLSMFHGPAAVFLSTTDAPIVELPATAAALGMNGAQQPVLPTAFGNVLSVQVPRGEGAAASELHAVSTHAYRRRWAELVAVAAATVNARVSLTPAEVDALPLSRREAATLSYDVLALRSILHHAVSRFVARSSILDRGKRPLPVTADDVAAGVWMWRSLRADGAAGSGAAPPGVPGTVPRPAVLATFTDKHEQAYVACARFVRPLTLLRIARCVVSPWSVDTRFDDIGALSHAKETLRELVMLPLQRPELFRAGVLRKAVSGVLLFGPPGTGKTMLAKAVAAESGATFLNVSMAELTSKYYGESEKIVHAVFSVAKRLAPSVIFLDELDSFLSSRLMEAEHEATRRMKNEFLHLWDGLASQVSPAGAGASAGASPAVWDVSDGRGAPRVMVLGATNRPFDLDDAVLRRMPRRVLIDVPGDDERVAILRKILRDDALDSTCDFGKLRDMTRGMTGSDLRDLCVAAAYGPVRDLVRSGAPQGASPRPISLGDFRAACADVRPSVSLDSASVQQLRRWNEQYGGTRGVGSPSQHTFGFGTTAQVVPPLS